MTRSEGPADAALLTALRGFVRSSDPTAGAPSGLYLSEAILRRERERIFARSWICVGRVDEFAVPGTYRALTLGDVPVVVVAQPDGAVHALSNVCRHRGTTIARGEGVAARLVCPYHAWTYDLDGRLRAAPFITDREGRNLGRAETFDPGRFRLPRYRTDTWGGFLYVNLDGDARPIAQGIGGLTEAFARYRLDEMRTVVSFDLEWRCNWKLAVENFCESYHVFKVHAKTIEPAWPTRTMEILPGGEGYNLHRRHAAPAGDDAGSYDLGARVNLACLYPAHALSVKDRVVTWICPLPIDVDRTRIHAGCAMLPDAQAPDGSSPEALERRVRVFLDEDRPLVESVQAGLRSGVLASGHCTAWEQPNRDFQRYLVGRLLADD